MYIMYTILYNTSNVQYICMKSTSTISASLRATATSVTIRDTSVSSTECSTNFDSKQSLQIYGVL